MSNLSRQKIFETAIASFLNQKREKEAQKKIGSKPEKYNKSDWLEKTAKILQKTSVQIGTHLPKATHSDVKGGMIYAKNLPDRKEIGTHLLDKSQIIVDAAGNGAENAVVLEAWEFLHLSIEVAGEAKFLKEWLAAEDLDAFQAVSEAPGKGKNIASRLMSFIERETARENEAVSDGNAKQIYWLKSGGDPLKNEDFMLLQPLYPTSLAHIIYNHVQNARFGKTETDKEFLKAGQEARKEGKDWAGVLEEFPNMARRSLGGTKPQNVSQLNSLRRGNMEFFSCAPPSWQSKGQRPPLKSKKPLMNWIMSRYQVRENLKIFVHFFKKNPHPDMYTRQRRDRLLDWITEDILSQAAELRLGLPAGWSADPECCVPECERLWLDTLRIEDKINFAASEDEDFRLKYAEGDWADLVATEMANFIMDLLLKAGLPVNSIDRDFIIRTANLITDVAWPTPMRRRAPVERKVEREGGAML